MKKRGLSEIVSYASLILISVALGVLLFSYLKVFVPKDRPQCTQDVELAVNSFNCVNLGPSNKLSLVLENRGFFTADVAYIRIGKLNRSFKADVPLTNPLPINNGTSEGLFPQDLTETLAFDLPADYSSIDNYTLEIQSAYFTDGNDPESLALCTPITQTINCK